MKNIFKTGKICVLIEAILHKERKGKDIPTNLDKVYLGWCLVREWSWYGGRELEDNMEGTASCLLRQTHDHEWKKFFILNGQYFLVIDIDNNNIRRFDVEKPLVFYIKPAIMSETNISWFQTRNVGHQHIFWWLIFLSAEKPLAFDAKPTILSDRYLLTSNINMFGIVLMRLFQSLRVQTETKFNLGDFWIWE